MEDGDIDEGLLKMMNESVKTEEVNITDKSKEDVAFDDAFQMLLEYYEGYEVDDTLSPFYTEE